MHVTLTDDAGIDLLSEYLLNEGFRDTVIQEAEAGIEDRFLELMEGGKA